jgi:hypothetical protein
MTAGEVILMGASQLITGVYKQHAAPELCLFLTSQAVSLLVALRESLLRSPRDPSPLPAVTPAVP